MAQGSREGIKCVVVNILGFHHKSRAQCHREILLSVILYEEKRKATQKYFTNVYEISKLFNDVCLYVPCIIQCPIKYGLEFLNSLLRIKKHTDDSRFIHSVRICLRSSNVFRPITFLHSSPQLCLQPYKG